MSQVRFWFIIIFRLISQINFVFEKFYPLISHFKHFLVNLFCKIFDFENENLVSKMSLLISQMGIGFPN